MKRYAAFAYDCYYPSGGWSDCVGMSDDIGEAVRFAHDSKRDCQEVVDLTEGRVVWQGTATASTVKYTGPMAEAAKDAVVSHFEGGEYQGYIVREWKSEP